MNKYPLYLQDDSSLDGVSCIRMILKYYGIEEDSLMIRKKCRTDRHGTTMKGLAEALSDYSIEATIRQVSSGALDQLPLPCILQLQAEKRPHVAVLYEKTGDECIIGDPAKGECHLSADELSEIYTGVLIQITHLGRYYEYGNKTLSKDLKQWRKSHHHWLWPLKTLALMSALSFNIIAGITTWGIDHLRMNNPWWLTYLAVLLFLLALALMSVAQNKLNKWEITIGRGLTEHFVLKSVRSCIDGDELVYSKGEWGVLNELSDMRALGDYSLHCFMIYHHDLIVIALMMPALLYLRLSLAVFSFLALIVFILLIYLQSRMISQRSNHALKSQHDLKEKLYEYIHLRVLRFLKGSSSWYKRYEMLFKNDQDSLKAYQRRIKTAMYLWLSGMLGVNLIGGFYFYHRQAFTKGRMLAYFMILLAIVYHFLPLADCLLKRPLALTLFEEFKELNSMELSRYEPFDEKITAITVNNLTYHYGSYDPVIHHFDALFDHSMFIKGSSGCGKTTLLKLLTGSDRVYHGNILINQREVAGLDRYDLSRHLTYVSEPLFVYGTIRENLMSDEQDVLPVLKKLNAIDLYQRLDLIILPDGSPLSQRDQALLMLARALVSSRDVYLLDGIFDHLSIDDYTEILNCLLNGFPDAFFLIVTSHPDDRLDSCMIEAQDLHAG